MALTARACRKAAQGLLPPKRVSLTSSRAPIALLHSQKQHLVVPTQPPRPFRSHRRTPKSYQRPASTSAVAPNSKAYLESGAIAGGQDLVDVSKVLVIGSGGLSIGQAGEFDYSGA